MFTFVCIPIIRASNVIVTKRERESNNPERLISRFCACARHARCSSAEKYTFVFVFVFRFAHAPNNLQLNVKL